MRRMGASRAVPRCQRFRLFLLASGTHRASLPAFLPIFAGKQDFGAVDRQRFRVKPGMRKRGGRNEEESGGGMRKRGAPRAVPRCPHFRPFLLASGTHRASLPAFLPIFAGEQDFGVADRQRFRVKPGMRGGPG